MCTRRRCGSGEWRVAALVGIDRRRCACVDCVAGETRRPTYFSHAQIFPAAARPVSATPRPRTAHVDEAAPPPAVTGVFDFRVRGRRSGACRAGPVEIAVLIVSSRCRFAVYTVPPYRGVYAHVREDGAGARPPAPSATPRPTYGQLMKIWARTRISNLALRNLLS